MVSTKKDAGSQEIAIYRETLEGQYSTNLVEKKKQIEIAGVEIFMKMTVGQFSFSCVLLPPSLPYFIWLQRDALSFSKMVVDGSGVVRYPSIHPKGHPHDAFEAIFWLCLGLSNNSKGMYMEGLTFKWDLTYYFLSIFQSWNLPIFLQSKSTCRSHNF